MKIPIARPWFTDAEHRALRAPLRAGWPAQGPQTQAFEQEFARAAGAPFAVAASSCTAAMHLALAALGVGPGDEVIVPSFTFVATANAVEYTGARPVFCDVLPRTYTIDPEDFERRITKRTRAVMPVHLFGLCADMPAIMQIARRHKLSVIEDAACAAGATWNGIPAGAFGHAGCFSFHGRKIITTGEGGMLVTRSRKLADRARSLRSHGESVSAAERHEKGGFELPSYDTLGFNYRMTDLQAAVGREQLLKLDRIIALRQKGAAYYTKHLGDMPGVTLPAAPEQAGHTFQSYVIVLDKSLNRNRVGRELAERGIGVRPGAHAVHMLGYYRNKYGHKPGDFPVARRLHEQSMALPLFPRMSRRDQDTVLECLRAVLAAQG